MDAELDVNQETELKEDLSSGVARVASELFERLRKYKPHAEQRLRKANESLLRLAKSGRTSELRSYLEDKPPAVGLLQITGLTENAGERELEENVSRDLKFLGEEDAEALLDTEEWNPLTFAVFHGHLDCVKTLVECELFSMKSCVKLSHPSLSSKNSLLFPLAIAFDREDEALFRYFFEEMSFLWGEGAIENLLKLFFAPGVPPKKRERYVRAVVHSPTTHALFCSMSFQYRSNFMETLLRLREEVEIGEAASLVLFEELALAPFSLYYFTTFIEKMADIEGGSLRDGYLDSLEKALGLLSAGDVEEFVRFQWANTSNLVNEMVLQREAQDSANEDIVAQLVYSFALKLKDS